MGDMEKQYQFKRDSLLKTFTKEESKNTKKVDKKLKEHYPSTRSRTKENLEEKEEKGKGLKNDKKVRFKVSSAQKLKKDSRYYIDNALLKKNILCVKYSSNANIHNKFKQTFISDPLKKIIIDYNKNNILDDVEILKLPKEEKRVLTNLLQLVGDENEEKYKDNTFEIEFKILLGEFRAGNTSTIVKNQQQQKTDKKIPWLFVHFKIDALSASGRLE